jgi:hypothetical protein
MGHYKGNMHDNSHKKGEGEIFVHIPNHILHSVHCNSITII